MPSSGLAVKKQEEAWLVWLSGLSAGLQTERLPVPFPVRARLGCRPGPQLGA